MKQRKENIIKTLEDAEAKQKEAEGLKEEYDSILQEVKIKKGKLLTEAEEEVKKEKDKMLQHLEREQAVARTEFEEQLQLEKRKFVNSVNKVVANKFAEFSQNVFSELANTDIEKQAIEVFISKIQALSKNEVEKVNSSAKAVDGQIIISTSKELGKEVEEKLKEALKKIGVQYKTILFEKDSEIILGIILKAGGYLISWDLREFLNNFKEELTKILK